MSGPENSPEGRHCPERVAELEQELGIERGGYDDETGEGA